MTDRTTVAIPNLPTVRQETIQDRVYRTLRTAIMAGRFAPGQQLTIRALAKELGTSAMPVRDAVGRLATEQAVEVMRNRAIIVPRMTSEKLRELIRVRVEVEGLAAEEAASRITPQELRKLDRISKEFLEAGVAGDLARYLARNQEFHFTIYRAAKMPILMRLIEGLWLQFGPTLNALLGEQSLSEYDTSHHDRARAALAAGDGKAARRAMAADLNEAAREMLQSDYFTKADAS